MNNINYANKEKDDNITAIVPVRNEELHIVACIESILSQTYPKEYMKVIFVDGMSTDKTREIINKYVRIYPDTFSLADNPKIIVPAAMNIGIDMATDNIIMRLDAHSIYNNNYVEKCVNTIKSLAADNVGGLVLTRGYGLIGETFAQVLSSKFGVGNSGFRTGAKSGYTDTVPFGTFKKETFEKYGKYDERLVRNQDYELNYRIRKEGGKIYLNSEIQLYYYCRNNMVGIIKHSFLNGKWNIITMELCPGSMGLRHFIPLLFILSLFILPILSILYKPVLYLFLTELMLYGSLDISFSAFDNKTEYRNHFLFKTIMFPLYHITYGIGSLAGIFMMFLKAINNIWRSIYVSVPKNIE